MFGEKERVSVGDGGLIINMNCLGKGRIIYFEMLRKGDNLDVFVGSILVIMYSKCGSINDV